LSQRNQFATNINQRKTQLPLAQAVEAPQTSVQDFSAHEAVWLFVRHADDLSQEERAALAAILSACEKAGDMYQLVQEFRQILHLREGEKLDEWLEKVRASHIRPLQSFVAGIERDKAAVAIYRSYGILSNKRK
jgi:transposase